MNNEFLPYFLTILPVTNQHWRTMSIHDVEYKQLTKDKAVAIVGYGIGGEITFVKLVRNPASRKLNRLLGIVSIDNDEQKITRRIEVMEMEIEL